ncbi:transposable element Tcb2 transposase [Trichonephila clavipes]|nr:transposable element Tcb2 transposase [Trichonephila clavipes]
MMKVGWSDSQIACQLGHSDCVVRRCWDQWIQEMSFTRRSGSGCRQQTSRREDRLIRPLRVLPLSPTHRRLRLEWRPALGNWTAAEWNQVVFSEEPRFNLNSDDNCVRVWRRRGKRLNPAFDLQRQLEPFLNKENAEPRMARVLQDCLRTVTTYLGLLDPQICLQSSISGILWNSELDIARV